MNDGSDLPRGRPSFVHELQFFAGTPAATASIITPPAPIYPPVPPGVPSIAHVVQFFAGPIVAPAALGIQPRPIYPDIVRGWPPTAHTAQAFAGPTSNTLTGIGFPGDGPDGAATFVLSLEPGTKVTYSWGTDIFKSYSGQEQRCNTTGPMPRQRFEGSAFLLDGSDRDVRGALQRAAAAGSTFLLALPYEELQLSADASGLTLPVPTTTRSDWATVTQRVMLIGTDGSTATAVIQAVTSTTIAVDTAPGTTGKAGARIQPLIQILLDPQQGFSRYAVNAGTWAIRAMANVFGWVGADSMGVGAQIVTYRTGGPVAASALTDADLLIWDRINEIAETASESMLSLTEIVDLGALPFGIGGADVPDWARPVRYSSTSQADWQWLKAFLRQVLGRQRVFLLSTNRADLTYVATVSGGAIKVSSATIGAVDYALWWTSPAHRRLAITKSTSSVQYVTVISAPVDNHDGTLTLTLDGVVTGTVTKISLLEQVRLDNNDSDDIAVTWDGAAFSVDLLARTCDDAIATLHGFPTTAAQMTTACRGGVWSAGWLCEDAASPLVAAFGGTNLPEAASGGSPVYQVAGPLGDKAVRVTVSNTGWQAASTAFLDPSATMDICGVVVMRTLLPLSVTTTFLSKTDFAGGPGFELTITNSVVTFNIDHTSPGNVTANATVPESLASNEWFAVMFAMDKAAGTMRVAIQSLITGAQSVSNSQAIGSLGSVSNASAAFRVARGGGLGNTLEVAGVYMAVAVGAAAGLPANLGTALSSFCTYLGA